MNALFPKVHFITGKGGVGKSLIARALAKLFAENGEKTLLVELAEEEAHEDRKADISLVEGSLYYVRLFPDQALYEYLSLKIHSDLVMNKLLKQNLFRALCSAMPGLADLTRLGKIWYHAKGHENFRGEIFDKIVVDLASSGFVPRFLSVASVVSDAVKIGPLAKEARLIENYFAQKEHAVVHIVCTPEEIVLKESQELYLELSKIRPDYCGILFMNRCLTIMNDELIKLGSNFSLGSPLLELFTCLGERFYEEQRHLNNLGPLAGLTMIMIKEHFGGVIESTVLHELKQFFSEELSYG